MYYPKSQISAPLYTSGKEYLLNGKNYVGNYWVDSKGNKYSGKSPQNPPNYLLTRVSEDVSKREIQPASLFIKEEDYYIAKKEKFVQIAPSPPTPSVTFPTDEEYETGEFQRYFVKKRNEIKYVEINKATYRLFTSKNQSVQWQLYSPIRISWFLTGKRSKVYEINRNIVLLYQRNSGIFGFLESFKNKFTKYFKYLPAENLETDGTEFKNKRTGEAYIGSYHVHPTKGPMVGAKHIQSKHDFLTEIEEILDETPNTVVTGSSYQPQTTRGSFGGY